MGTIITCSLLTLLSIIMLLQNDSDTSTFGLFLLFLTIVFGWGFCGCLIPQRSEIKDIKKFTYAKTESAVMIECNGLTYTFTDAQTYNAITDSARLQLNINYNIYGKVAGTDLIIKTKNGLIIKK